MKKIFRFAFTLFTVIFITSCSSVGGKNGSAPNGIGKPFTASVNIVLDDMNSEGKITRYGKEMWDIEFSSPATISGVLLSFADGNVDASYKGLNFSVPQSALPIKAMMTNLISAAEKIAADDKLEGNEKDGNIQIEGRLDGGDYILTVDKNGNIVKFEMPASKLVMTFTDVTETSVSQQSSQTALTENTASEITSTTAEASVTTQAN